MTKPPRFSLQRRWLLGSALVATVAGLTVVGVRRRTTNRPSGLQATLASVVDTIVPADEFAGGLDLGLDQRMIQRIEQRPQTRALNKRLMHAIDQLALNQHHQAFHRLDIDQREALLSGLLTSKSQRQTRADLIRFRASILTWYYHSEPGHQSLGYRLPAHYPTYRS